VVFKLTPWDSVCMEGLCPWPTAAGLSFSLHPHPFTWNSK
jgi:hypothetical protein